MDRAGGGGGERKCRTKETDWLSEFILEEAREGREKYRTRETDWLH